MLGRVRIVIMQDDAKVPTYHGRTPLNMIMTDYIYWCDFAPDDLLALARSTALEQRQSFVEASVTTNEANFRKSKVLWRQHYPTLDTEFTARLEIGREHV